MLYFLFDQAYISSDYRTSPKENAITMTTMLDIPDDLKQPFRRILLKIPHEFQDDTNFLEVILVFLKLGGERLARQWIEVTKVRHRQEYNHLSNLHRREAMIRAASTEDDENRDENEDEDDEDHGEDDDNERDHSGDDLDVDSLDDLDDDDYKTKSKLDPTEPYT
jgi:hypothetical protein